MIFLELGEMSSSCSPRLFVQNHKLRPGLTPLYEPKCALGIVNNIGGTFRLWLVGKYRYRRPGGGEEPLYTSPHRSNIVPPHLMEKRSEVRARTKIDTCADCIKCPRR